MTFIQSAIAKGVDESPPAYQFDKGFGEGVDKWLIHIQGEAGAELLNGKLPRNATGGKLRRCPKRISSRLQKKIPLWDRDNMLLGI
ncbi:pectin acetylesterase 8-like protein [Tanacetum coccineum]